MSEMIKIKTYLELLSSGTSGVHEDLEDLGTINVATSALANDLVGTNDILEESLVDGGEATSAGTTSEALSLSDMDSGVEGGTLSNNDNVGGELLLESSNNLSVVGLGLLEETEGENNNKSLTLAGLDFLNTIDGEVLEGSLKVTRLKLNESLSNLGLNGGNLSVLASLDDLRSHLDTRGHSSSFCPPLFCVTFFLMRHL